MYATLKLQATILALFFFFFLTPEMTNQSARCQLTIQSDEKLSNQGEHGSVKYDSNSSSKKIVTLLSL